MNERFFHVCIACAVAVAACAPNPDVTINIYQTGSTASSSGGGGDGGESPGAGSAGAGGEGGGPVVVPNDGTCGTLPDDGDPCTVAGCEAGAVKHVPVAGLPCGSDGKLACDDSGFCAGCGSYADCGVGTVCALWACDENVCAKVLLAAGTPLKTQQAYDCKEVQCDGQGSTLVAVDESDVPEEDCWIGACDGDVPSKTPTAPGVACDVNGGKSCDGEGNCVECILLSDCGVNMGWLCAANGKCHRCDDQIKNGDETGIDCGGGCPPCP